MLSHGSVDRQRNDRLGRTWLLLELFEQRQDMLRTICPANVPHAHGLHPQVQVQHRLQHHLISGERYNPVTDSWTATSTTNAPDGRAGHTAVWTGAEMIVWGGSNDIGFLNTGGSYNPSSNSWMATSTTNAPAARGFHTAVWTGSEMIVWGGWHLAPRYLNTGARYNPSTDSWTATRRPQLALSRGHTAVWTGTEMIVWGGNGIGVCEPREIQSHHRHLDGRPPLPTRPLSGLVIPQSGGAAK